MVRKKIVAARDFIFKIISKRKKIYTNEFGEDKFIFDVPKLSIQFVRESN